MTKIEDRQRARDIDGRVPVDALGPDPLLQQLKLKHFVIDRSFVIDVPRPPTNPGAPDDTGSSG